MISIDKNRTRRVLSMWINNDIFRYFIYRCLSFRIKSDVLSLLIHFDKHRRLRFSSIDITGVIYRYLSCINDYHIVIHRQIS